MANIKVLLLNGPPRSGKDSIARGLVKELDGCKVILIKTSDWLKDTVHSFLALDKFTNYEALKDTPLPEYNNRTLREIYIRFSENFAKPLFGADFFGKQMLETLKHIKIQREGLSLDTLIIITDVGFEEEVGAYVTQLGVDNFLLLRISRTGASFRGDSRVYITDNFNVRTRLRILDIYNKEFKLPDTVKQIAAYVHTMFEQQKSIRRQ